MTTVEKIHHEIDTAQDRLYRQALDIINSSKQVIIDPSLLKKSERLKKLGFISTNTAKEATKLLSEKNAIEASIAKTKEQAELIQYYKHTYPFQKFLTKNELNRICEEYGLIYASVSNYIGDVPEKNLQDIENAKPLSENDIAKDCFLFVLEKWWDGVPLEQMMFYEEHKNEFEFDNDPRVFDYLNVPSERIIKSKFIELEYTGQFGKYTFKKGNIEYINKKELHIVATKNHFNLKGLEQKEQGFLKIIKTKIYDPIVFRYCRGGIQVITKWGAEADIDEFKNPKDN